MSVIDPIQFQKLCWPHVNLYDRQKEILYSVKDNDETYVPAGNALGKDFVGALCAIWWLRSRRPSRVVTTSPKFDQLNDVLWGEIRNFISTSVVDLQLHIVQMKIRQILPSGGFAELTELVGQVINKGESLLGRHAPRLQDGTPTTLLIGDEVSGLEERVYESADTWAHHKLFIGNCYPCTNFWKRNITLGDMKRPNGSGGYLRKIIKIRAEDSPNVRLAVKQKAGNREITNEILIPGVKDYETYLKHRSMWDKVRQCIGLDAEFYEGSELLLFPPDWLNAAERRHNYLARKKIKRIAKAIGCDPAEGGDSSCWSVVDELGLIELISMKTPDTSVIPARTIALGRRYRVSSENWVFDRGGGGKQHADALRRRGFKPRTVGFGEKVQDDKKHTTGIKSRRHKVDVDEDKYVYFNRRAQMFGELSEVMEATEGKAPFAFPAEYVELRRQLAPIPKRFDGEGKLYLPPKHKKSKDSREETLYDMLGCSPDEADSLALAVFGMNHKPVKNRIGVI